VSLIAARTVWASRSHESAGPSRLDASGHRPKRSPSLRPVASDRTSADPPRSCRVAGRAPEARPERASARCTAHRRRHRVCFQSQGKHRPSPALRSEAIEPFQPLSARTRASGPSGAPPSGRAFFSARNASSSWQYHSKAEAKPVKRKGHFGAPDAGAAFAADGSLGSSACRASATPKHTVLVITGQSRKMIFVWVVT